MAYVLTASQFASGLQQNSAKLLQSLRHITEVSPFNIADVRIQLELNQIQTFTDDAFRDFLSELYNLEIDYSLLSPTEITVVNVIREFLDPPPMLACCGSAPPTLLNTTQVYNDRIGSASFEKEAQIQLDNDVICDVFDIEMTWTPIGIAPAILVAVNILNPLGCISNKNTFSYVWIDFAADPTGFTYNVDINLRDNTTATIALLNQNFVF